MVRKKFTSYREKAWLLAAEKLSPLRWKSFPPIYLKNLEPQGFHRCQAPEFSCKNAGEFQSWALIGKNQPFR
ncbi:MAG: hypothetical protein RR288_04240, partial [Oscillibacter sp.]